MLRLLFTTEDNSQQLTVITDGIDSQLKVFVTENTVGAVDYFAGLGIVIEPGMTYNLGKFKEWAKNNRLVLIAYPEGLDEQAQILQDVTEDWRYTFTTSTPELNFPNIGGNEEYVITSGKQLYVNGEPEGNIEPVELTVQVVGEGFAVQEGTTVSATQNPTEAERNGTLIATQDESGEVINISLIQAASVITYNQVLSVTPMTLNFDPKGQTQTFNVNSKIQTVINGSVDSETEEPYETVVTGEGFVKSSNTAVTASENTNETSPRTGKATVTAGERVAEVELVQAKAVVSYNYELTVDPMQLSFVAEGETKIFGVTSNKTKTVNGREEGTPIAVDYTTVVTGEGFLKGASEYSVIASENPSTTERNGVATVSMAEGGKSAEVDLVQAAATA